MGYGVDRGGGRESKGGSLRRSKKNPGAAAARAAQHTKHLVVETSVSLPAPVLHRLGIDCSVALLSRKLDPTRESLVKTAKDSDCGAIVTWCSEVDKQKALLHACTGSSEPTAKFTQTARGFTSTQDDCFAYCYLGVHPDNVDRTNKKAHEGWLAEVEVLAKSPCCVALLTGINLTREMNTHFAQEALLSEVCRLATTKLMLPVVIYTPKGDAASLERALELALPIMQDPSRIIIADVLACQNPATIEVVAKAGVWATLSGTWIATADDAATELDSEAVKCVKAFPSEQLLLATNSPWSTPQTLKEEHMRQLPNEPCNLVEVAELLSTVRGTNTKALLKLSTQNAQSAFRFGAAVAVASKQKEEESDGDRSSASEDDDEDEVSGDEEEKETSAKVSKAASNNVAVEDSNNVERPVARKNTKASCQFSCVKCRKVLFIETDLVTHPEGAEKVIFTDYKRGGRSTRGDTSCESAFFLDGAFDIPSTVFVNREGTVECRSCDGKLGNLGHGVACPCGCAVPGASLRIIASRVDRVEELSEQELLDKAALERAALLEADQQQQEQAAEDEEAGRTKKQPKKNVKASNTANMGSSYRNKSFVPVKAPPGTLDLESELAELKGGGGGERTYSDSDDGGSKKKNKNKKGKRRNNKYDE